jgi:hypothetical protein
MHWSFRQQAEALSFFCILEEGQAPIFLAVNGSTILAHKTIPGFKTALFIVSSLLS